MLDAAPLGAVRTRTCGSSPDCRRGRNPNVVSPLDLATYSRIQATTALNEKYVFTLHTRPTPTQQRVFELLGINPDRTQ